MGLADCLLIEFTSADKHRQPHREPNQQHRPHPLPFLGPPAEVRGRAIRGVADSDCQVYDLHCEYTMTRRPELLIGRLFALAFPLVILSAPANGQAAELQGQVLQASFEGPFTHVPVHYSIYLPPGYEEGSERYPVVYHLHGLNGSYAGMDIQRVPAAYEAAAATGRAGRYIIVFPDGYTNSWWADSWDGTKPAETNLVYELIPYIDETYRTRAGRPHRVIQGMSMGGWGAIKFMAKFPYLFRACITYDAAIHNWYTFSSMRSEAAEIFNNDQRYFDLYSPWPYLEPNASFLRQNGAIRVLVGSIKEGNEALRDVLNSWGIRHDYIQTTCAHSLVCLLDEEGFWSAVFIERCTRPGRRRRSER